MRSADGEDHRDRSVLRQPIQSPCTDESRSPCHGQCPSTTTCPTSPLPLPDLRSRSQAPFLHTTDPSYPQIRSHICLSSRLCIGPNSGSKFQRYPVPAAQFNHDLQTDLPVRCEVLFVSHFLFGIKLITGSTN